MIEEGRSLPGWPGIPGRWTGSTKSGLGTARQSREPGVVHPEPRHSERGVLPAR